MIDENDNRAPDPKPHMIRENGVLWLKMPDGQLHLMTPEDTFQLLSSCMSVLQGGYRNQVYGAPQSTENA